jgi:hypothetical protein
MKGEVTMKKAVKIVLCVLLVVIIAGGAVAGALLPHPLRYKIKDIQNIGSRIEVLEKTGDRVTIRNTQAGNLKVVTFTDTHLDGNNKTSDITVGNMVNNIIKEKPDLVIFGGDNVTSAFNKKRANQFAQIFENFGIYWAAVLGNHEGDNPYSIKRPEMVDIFSSYEHCLMLKGSDEVWGNGNYCIDILNSDNSFCHAFIFLDTGNEMSEQDKEKYGIPADENPDDGVKESQVEWYRGIIESGKKQYGEYPSSVIMHIPLPQMKQEAEKGEFLEGVKLEGVCASGFDAGMFDAIKQGGSTKKVWFGHDHLNAFSLMYDGILLGYLQTSGYGSYGAAKLGYDEKDWLQGYSVMDISPAGEYELVRFRNAQSN